MAEQLQGPVHSIETHILVADVADRAGRVGPAFDAAASPRRLVLRAAGLAACRSNVREGDVRHRPVANPADGEAVPTVTREVADDRVTTTAQNVARVREAEVPAVDELADRHDRNAVITVVHHGILQHSVKAPVDIDAIRIWAAVRRCKKNKAQGYG